MQAPLPPLHSHLQNRLAHRLRLGLPPCQTTLEQRLRPPQPTPLSLDAGACSSLRLAQRWRLLIPPLGNGLTKPCDSRGGIQHPCATPGLSIRHVALAIITPGLSSRLVALAIIVAFTCSSAAAAAVADSVVDLAIFIEREQRSFGTAQAEQPLELAGSEPFERDADLRSRSPKDLSSESCSLKKKEEKKRLHTPSVPRVAALRS